MLTQSKNTEDFFFLNVTTILVCSMLSLIFVDIRPELSVLDLFGVFLSICGYYLFYLGTITHFNDLDA